MSEFNGKTDKPRLMTSIGYARVSTGEQDTALQLDALRKAGCERLFEDKASGVKTDRPGLAEAIRYVRDGDTLTVWSSTLALAATMFCSRRLMARSVPVSLRGRK